MTVVIWQVDSNDLEQQASLERAGWSLTNLKLRGANSDLLLFAKEFGSQQAAEQLVSAVPTADFVRDSQFMHALHSESSGIGELWPNDIAAQKLSPADAAVRRRYLRAVADMAEEMVKQVKVWKVLAWVAVVIVALTLIFGGVQISHVVGKVTSSDATGYQLIGIIFALAVFVASPGVLFLLGRPLKGIDEWTPDGVLKSEKEGDDGGEGEGEDPKT